MPVKQEGDLRAMERGSIAMAKSTGDIGQPWQVPLERDTQAEGAEYKSCVQEINS